MGGGGTFTVHKPGEGSYTRLGLFVLSCVFVIFAAHHWYYNWGSLRDFATKYMGLDFLVGWTIPYSKVVSIVGAIAVCFSGAAVAYYYIYCKQRSAEFLVKTDVELGKVTWPKISPWFKMDTPVWGATYVVLIVVAFLTLYVFGVDFILQSLAKFLFYSG